MGKLPFWFYKYMTIIIKKGGYPLLVAIGALITQGSIKTVKDLRKFIDKE
jgi:hypothetical protein